MNALNSSQSSYHGCLGAMGPTPCYGTHLARSILNLECSKVTPLGPLLFALVLHKLVASVEADDECFDLLLQGWYLDDRALAGSRPAVLRALHLIEEMGPALGLHVNLAKLWTILQKLPHMRNKVTATWRLTAATSTSPDSNFLDSAHLPATVHRLVH